MVLVQVICLFDDLGIPLSYRHMDGHAISTFTLINAAGNATYVRFHWLTQQGAHAMWMQHLFLLQWRGICASECMLLVAEGNVFTQGQASLMLLMSPAWQLLHHMGTLQQQTCFETSRRATTLFGGYASRRWTHGGWRTTTSIRWMQPRWLFPSPGHQKAFAAAV